MTANVPAAGAAGGEACWEIACDATLEHVLGCAPRSELFRRTLTGAMSWHVRNRTTVDRVLATPSTALSWFAALLALGAEVRAGGQVLPVETFLERRAKGAPEALRIPALQRSGAPHPAILWGEARVARTPSDEPIVLAIAVLESAANAVTRARLALTGAWARPAGLSATAGRLVGRGLSAAAIGEVAAATGEEVAPKGDFLGSADYRRAMAGVLARRALEQCLARCAAPGDPTEEGRHGR